MRYVSLFSGIGGVDLGLDRAGMTCAYQVEIDPFCRKVLAKHWPDVPKWDDIKTFPWTHAMSLLSDVDMVAGGFPCQAVSKAGKMRGEEDERFLWPEMYRVCKKLQPRYILVENVTGLLSAPDRLGRRGALFGGILGDLAALGYCVEWHCIPAASVNALHRRDRVWIVAYSEHDGLPEASGRGDHRGVQQQQGREKESKGSEQSPSGSYQPSLFSDVPDTTGSGRNKRGGRTEQEGERGTKSSVDSKKVSDTDKQGLEGHSGDGADGGQSGRVIQGAAGPVTKSRLRRFADRTGSAQWGIEPDVGRVADGVPARVDRLRSLGNAVVPQVVEFLGRCIMDKEDARKARTSGKMPGVRTVPAAGGDNFH